MRRGETAEVVVVGGGINGASIAFHLAARGITDVVVLERAYPGAGASSRGMGLLRTYHANEPEAVLAIRSLDVFRNWEERVGGSCGYVETGFLWLDTETAGADVRRNIDLVNRNGGNARFLTGRELQGLQPHLDTDGIVAAYEPDSGYAYGAPATDALLAAARRLGVRLKTRTPATALLSSRGRVTGVVTPSGSISAGKVVLAAGAWTAPLAAAAGVELPIAPRRLTIGRVYLPPGLRDAITFLDAAVDTAFKPDGAQTALISARDSRYGTRVDPDLLAEDVEFDAISRGILKLARRMPDMKHAVGGRTWTGVDGFTPDYRGIYGAVDGCEGLLICAGASEKGFKVAPAVGMSMAELIDTGRCGILDGGTFSAHRFAGRRERDRYEEVSVTDLI